MRDWGLHRLGTGRQNSSERLALLGKAGQGSQAGGNECLTTPFSWLGALHISSHYVTSLPMTVQPRRFCYYPLTKDRAET